MDESTKFNNGVEKIMDAFTGDEKVVILELARVSLADSEIYDKVADETDLSDEYLKKLQEKIETVTNGEMA